MPKVMAALLSDGGDDGGATVRAALAFIDECDRELARYPVDVPAVPLAAPFAASAASPALGKPRRNPSRDKQKHEKLALRAQVADLSDQLMKLQRSKDSKWGPGSGGSSGEGAGGAADAQLCQLWREVALRHRRRRRQAGEENSELRAAISRQLQVIQLMRKILVRQAVDRPLVVRLRQPHCQDGCALPQDVVDELLASLSRPTNGGSRLALSLDLLLLPRMQMQQVSPTRTRMTLVESRYIPFGAAAAANALWASGDKQCYVHRVSYKKHSQTPERTFMRSYTATHQCEGLDMKSIGHQAARMFTADDGVTIAYASVDRPSTIGEWRDASGIKISEKGWIMLTSPSASTSSPSGSSLELTLMQIYWDVTLDVGLDVPERNRYRKALIDAISRLREKHLRCSQQLIEDALLTSGVD